MPNGVFFVPRGAGLECRLLSDCVDLHGGRVMKPSDDIVNRSERTAVTDVDGRPRSVALHNDRTHDSTVDTDGKNREAARLAGDGPISPDEVTTSNATLENNVPETPDGLAGFDSRITARRLPFATQPGYEVVDRGMVEPELPRDPDVPLVDPNEPTMRRSPGRIHYSLNHLRPTRIIELRPSKR